MAVSNCKECGRQVSSKAKACPHCGAKAPKTTSIFSVVLVSLLVFAVYTGYVPDSTNSNSVKNTSSTPTSEKKDERSQRTKEYLWIEEGKDSVRAKLKDADSAKFKNVYFFRGSRNIPVTCGDVNSKNSFGAYAGFSKFISAGSIDATYLESEVEDFAELWNGLCAK